MNKTEDEAYNLIEEMALNNFQWSTEQGQPQWVGSKLSSVPPQCKICGFIEHVTLNCQVGSLFS